MNFWGYQVDIGSGTAAPACGQCGSVLGKIVKPTGPHVARLDCAGCGRYIMWLSVETTWQLLPESEWRNQYEDESGD